MKEQPEQPSGPPEPVKPASEDKPGSCSGERPAASSPQKGNTSERSSQGNKETDQPKPKESDSEKAGNVPPQPKQTGQGRNRRRNHKGNGSDADIPQWYTRKSAAAFLDVSVDTIERRAIPWSLDPVPGRLRYRLLRLGENTREGRRYYGADLEALLN